MFISKSEGETIAFGRECGAHAHAGDIFALIGPIGAGKTHFVKGFVAGAGSLAIVTSPTFTLVHEYDDGRLPIFHFDFYRLENATAATQIGLDEYFAAPGVCIIEWADRFPELLPAHTRQFHFEVGDGDARSIHEAA